MIDYQAVAKASTPGSAIVADAPKDTALSVSSTQVADAALSRDDEALLDPSGTSAPIRTETDALQLSIDELLNRKLDELRAAREANKLKDSEIATLKKEATLVKKELRQRTDEIKALKAVRPQPRQLRRRKRRKRAGRAEDQLIQPMSHNSGCIRMTSLESGWRKFMRL